MNKSTGPQIFVVELPGRELSAVRRRSLQGKLAASEVIKWGKFEGKEWSEFPQSRPCSQIF